MASQTERADILEIALAAAFGDGHDVVRIPETSSHALSESPVLQQKLPILTSRKTKLARSDDGIQATGGTHTAIAEQDVFAQIGGLGAQLPLMHTETGAERESSSRHFEGAPAAEASAVRPARDGFAIYPPAGHDTRCAHASLL